MDVRLMDLSNGYHWQDIFDVVIKEVTHGYELVKYQEWLNKDGTVVDMRPYTVAYVPKDILILDIKVLKTQQRKEL